MLIGISENNAKINRITRNRFILNLIIFISASRQVLCHFEILLYQSIFWSTSGNHKYKGNIIKTSPKVKLMLSYFVKKVRIYECLYSKHDPLLKKGYFFTHLINSPLFLMLTFIINSFKSEGKLQLEITFRRKQIEILDRKRLSDYFKK